MEPLWVHFEGRNLDNVETMMHLIRSHESGEGSSGHVISLEIEALRNEWKDIQPCAASMTPPLECNARSDPIVYV